MLSLTDNEFGALVEAARGVPVQRRSDLLQLVGKYKNQNLIISIHRAHRELHRAQPPGNQ
jgi:hypothetical protein